MIDMPGRGTDDLEECDHETKVVVDEIESW